MRNPKKTYVFFFGGGEDFGQTRAKKKTKKPPRDGRMADVLKVPSVFNWRINGTGLVYISYMTIPWEWKKMDVSKNMGKPPKSSIKK